jgi:hypothetical protein
MVLDCPYCRAKLDVRGPVTEDYLIRCPKCNFVSALDRGIRGYGLVFSSHKYD